MWKTLWSDHLPAETLDPSALSLVHPRQQSLRVAQSKIAPSWPLAMAKPSGSASLSRETLLEAEEVLRKQSIKVETEDEETMARELQDCFEYPVNTTPLT